MARLPRFFVPDLPLHVIQRGNNRAPIFVDPVDFAFYRTCLAYAARRCGVSIHAYVFMTNHVHLMVTPERATSTARMMQSIGRLYVQYFNARCGRTGTLWEGRYKAAIVDDEGYLLTCMRYVELNPVRAGMVMDPRDYPWSSHRANALGENDDLVRPHPIYLRLGCMPGRRQQAYCELFGRPIQNREIETIRDATQHAWALGDTKFRQRILVSGRRPTRLPRGRAPPDHADMGQADPENRV
jgi:putative transposase